MVNNIGQWTFVPNTPEDKKCDLDRAAEVVMKMYQPREIDLESLLLRLIADAEEQYMTDIENSLYKDNKLNKEVFEEYLSLICISDYDYKG